MRDKIHEGFDLREYVEKRFKCCNCGWPIFVLITGDVALTHHQMIIDYIWRCTNPGGCGCNIKWQDSITPAEGGPKKDGQ